LRTVDEEYKHMELSRSTASLNRKLRIFWIIISIISCIALISSFELFKKSNTNKHDRQLKVRIRWPKFACLRASADDMDDSSIPLASQEVVDQNKAEESKPSAVDAQQLTEKSKPSAVDAQQLTEKSKPSAVDAQQLTEKSKPSAVDAQQLTEKSKESAVDAQQLTEKSKESKILQELKEEAGQINSQLNAGKFTQSQAQMDGKLEQSQEELDEKLAELKAQIDEAAAKARVLYLADNNGD